MDPISRQSSTTQTRERRKRTRPTLSCGHCRFRKLRCNRATPCESCLKSGDGATCYYGSNEKQEDYPKTQMVDRDALISRIDRLESLLQSAVRIIPHPSTNNDPEVLNIPGTKNRAQIQQSPDKQTDDMEVLGKEFGVLRVEPTPTYHGGQHWVSTMFQIQEFRDYLETNSDELERVAVENKKAGGRDIVSLLRGTSTPFTRDEVLSCIPSRIVADMLVSRFFTHVSHDIPVLHESTFRQEYIEHWEVPEQTTLPWLGLLFSIFHHGQLSFDGNHDDVFQSSAEVYRRRTIQCLIAANYAEPQLYTVEALILHIYAEWMSSQDSSIDVSLMLGIVIRLAMRMGMHRDTNANDNMSPFQGEMRRRVWHIIRAMDIICSFQLSLPATIHDTQSRCAAPKNLFNSELHKSMTELPPSRMLSEPTEISGEIIKTRLVIELGKIVAFAESEDDPTYEAISQYDESLEEVKHMIPEHLNAASTQDLVPVSAKLNRNRIDVDRVYQTSKCVLYRTSLSKARLKGIHLKHRGLCIDAAMTLLALQATLYLDPNSPYAQNIRRRHLYTLTTHDFFTAAMAVALDLHYGFETEPFYPSPSDVALWGYDRRNEMITALETSAEFCRVSKDDSVEAANAYGMLCYVVAKARKAQWMIAEKKVKGNSNSPASQASNLETAAPAHEILGTEIFDEPIPDFNWNLWNQFNNNYDDLQPFAQWGDIIPDSMSA